jgi:hypothetical protein
MNNREKVRINIRRKDVKVLALHGLPQPKKT